MQVFKKAVPFLFLSLFSSMVNAQYEERLRLFLHDDDEFYSSTPTSGITSREKTVYNTPNDVGGMNYSVFKAELSADPLPYVSTSYSTYLKTGERGYEYNRGTFYPGLFSSINYDFNVSGTPNSIIPVSMKALARFDNSNNIQTRNYSDINYTNGREGTSSQVNLDVQISDSNVGGDNGNYSRGNFSFTGGCSIDRCTHYVTNPGYLDYPFDSTIKINGQEWLNDANNFYAYNSPIGEERNILETNGVNRSFDEILIEATFRVMLDENGISQGRVSMFSTSNDAFSEVFTIGAIFDGQQSIFANTSSYLDPFFSIDPTYLSSNPNARLSFTPGVGNLNPLSPVPEPSQSSLIACGFLILLACRKKISK